MSKSKEQIGDEIIAAVNTHLKAHKQASLTSDNSAVNYAFNNQR